MVSAPLISDAIPTCSVVLADLATISAKPRFIIENDQLKLIHQPVTPPDQLLDVLTNFYLHPLSEHEGYYDSRFAQQWWLESKVIALIINSLNPPPQERSIGTVTPEELDLAERIIMQFGNEVTEQGSQFVVVHLPGKIHLEYFLRKGSLGYYSTLERIAEKYPVRYLESVITESLPSYWQPQTHYSDSMNQILADFTANQIKSCLDNKTCFPRRFSDQSAFTSAS